MQKSFGQIFWLIFKTFWLKLRFWYKNSWFYEILEKFYEKFKNLPKWTIWVGRACKTGLFFRGLVENNDDNRFLYCVIFQPDYLSGSRTDNLTHTPHTPPLLLKWDWNWFDPYKSILLPNILLFKIIAVFKILYCTSTYLLNVSITFAPDVHTPWKSGNKSWVHLKPSWFLLKVFFMLLKYFRCYKKVCFFFFFNSIL